MQRSAYPAQAARSNFFRQVKRGTQFIFEIRRLTTCSGLGRAKPNPIEPEVTTALRRSWNRSFGVVRLYPTGPLRWLFFTPSGLQEKNTLEAENARWKTRCL